MKSSPALAALCFLCSVALPAGCGSNAAPAPEDGGAAYADGGPTIADGGAAHPDGGGLGGRDGGLACDPSVPRTEPVVVNVYPDDGEDPYVQTIEKAARDVRVMIYLMGTGRIMDALKRKAGAGVRVRVILDKDQPSNMRYFTELTTAGAQVIWSADTFTFMHAKVIIADDKEAIISSGNYASFAIARERNHSATLRDPDDLATLLELFDADYQRRSPSVSCTRLIISPTNARQRLLDFIGTARVTLDIESMQLADDDIRDKVAQRKAAGVAVRVLLADPSWIDANAGASQYLALRGIPARWRTNPSVHTKSLVIDGARAYVGSENFSFTSLNRNREVGVLLDDAAALARMKAVFESDWSTATNF